MKRIDWIIGIVLFIALVAVALYYFLGYKQGKTVGEIFGSPASSGPSNSSSSATGGSQNQQSQQLPFGSYPVELGQKSQLVVYIQRALNYLGADLIVDGVFGNLTKSALVDEMGVNSVDQSVAAALYVKVQDWALAKTPPDNAILNELKQIVPL